MSIAFAKVMHPSPTARAMVARRYLLLMVFTAVMLLGNAVAFAQTAVPPPEIDLDVTPLFTSMNGYLPVFLGIFAIPGGIMLAVLLSRMLMNLIGNAIKSAAGGGK